MKEVYLDSAATTSVLPEAAEAAKEAMLKLWGNPSSSHRKGIEAEDLLRSCRGVIARTIGAADAGEVLFTSGGSEANSLAILGCARTSRKKGRIITTAIEHPSVMEACKALENEGFEVIWVAPDSAGNVNADDFIRHINDDTILCSMMLVNNELGAILPVAAVAGAIRAGRYPCKLHCDGVQALGKIPILADELGCDFLSVSAHKLHGPKGVGALYIRKGTRIKPLRFGGGQQGGIHPGTEPMPAIAAFARTVEMLPELPEETRRLRGLNNYARERLSTIEHITFNSDEAAHPGILSIATGVVKSEVMLNFLSDKGIYVSSGSACSRGKRSHVLAAAGLPNHIIDSTIRVSFSRFTSTEDIDALVGGLSDGIKNLAHFR